MIEFFMGLDTTVQVAVVSLCCAVAVAVINGFFQLISNRKKSGGEKQGGNDDCAAPNDKTVIKQNINGRHNTVIGIQNNKKDGE